MFPRKATDNDNGTNSTLTYRQLSVACDNPAHFIYSVNGSFIAVGGNGNV
jgi:hypothetical protein